MKSKATVWIMAGLGLGLIAISLMLKPSLKTQPPHREKSQLLSQLDSSQDIEIIEVDEQTLSQILDTPPKTESYPPESTATALAPDGPSLPPASRDNKNEVSDTLKREANHFRRCYMQLAQRLPSAKGELKIKFNIEPNGKVSSVQIMEPHWGDTDFHNCLTSIIKRTEFKKGFPRGTIAVFPLRFE